MIFYLSFKNSDVTPQINPNAAETIEASSSSLLCCPMGARQNQIASNKRIMDIICNFFTVKTPFINSNRLFLFRLIKYVTANTTPTAKSTHRIAFSQKSRRGSPTKILTMYTAKDNSVMAAVIRITPLLVLQPLHPVRSFFAFFGHPSAIRQR